MKTFITFIVIVAGLLVLYQSQARRLAAYSEWYCTEIYGLNSQCNGRR